MFRSLARGWTCVYNAPLYMKRASALPTKLVVTEIFHSLQGEGPHLGVPSVFIRLGGCIEPLCPWCDTKYAWHDFEEMEIDKIVAEVNRYGCKEVVLTGGEPFLQWENGLEALHQVLRDRGHRILYETSGKAGIPALVDATVVVSPKYIGGRWHIDAQDLLRAHWYKFVSAGGEDHGAISEFVRSHALDPSRVFVMPRGASRAEQLDRMKEVFAFCREAGFTMTPRLHVLIFDNQRGI